MIKCPKCRAKGSSVALNELWNGGGLHFDQNDDGSISDKGIVSEGGPVGVEGICLSCGHIWKIRGVSQITELQNRTNQP